MSERRTLELEPADTLRLANLCGQFDQHLQQIEARLDVEVFCRGNIFNVEGESRQVRAAVRWMPALRFGLFVVSSALLYLGFSAPALNTLWFVLAAVVFVVLVGCAAVHEERERHVEHATARYRPEGTSSQPERTRSRRRVLRKENDAANGQ